MGAEETKVAILENNYKAMEKKIDSVDCKVEHLEQVLISGIADIKQSVADMRLYHQKEKEKAMAEIRGRAKKNFAPSIVGKIVFGMIGLILSGVLGAILAIVVK